MPTAWRLLKTKYLSRAWDGEGARLYGARWNRVGTPLVYTAATLSLALVETLVHIPPGPLPAFTAIEIDFDASLVTILPDRNLPTDWKAYPHATSTQAIGEKWVREAKSAVLRVPSVVVPMEFNYLLNPRHRDFSRIAIGTPMRFPFDPRLPLP